MSSDTQIIDMTRGVYRRVYAGFLTGRRINSVSIPAEAWFWRLLMVADDFGNLHAEPELLKNTVAPLRKCTRPQAKQWTAELIKAGLVTSYESNGEKYLHINDFEQTQPAGRNGRRIKKYPGCEIPGNPEKPCKSVHAHSEAEAEAHTDTHPHTDRGAGAAVLRRLGVSGRVIGEIDATADTVIRHWLTIDNAKKPVGALVARLRSGEPTATQPTPAMVAKACREGVITSITLDGKRLEVHGLDAGANSRGVVIGTHTLPTERIGEAVFG